MYLDNTRNAILSHWRYLPTITSLVDIKVTITALLGHLH